MLILNPNLQRGAEQIRHVFDPEALIQTNFAGWEGLNAQFERMLARGGEAMSEARLAEKFIYKNIRYATDYETWGNLEYWPRAEEVWALRREDCDGRAILAVSLLRGRGYQSARLMVGLDHMWAQVDENEQDGSLPPNFIALLGPGKDFSLAMSDKPRSEHFLALAKAFFQPEAFRKTTAQLIADIPPLRKALLITIFLALCFHPCSHRTALLGVLMAGLIPAAILANLPPGDADGGRFLAAMVLLSLAAWAAWRMEKWVLPKPAAVPDGSTAKS